MSSKKRPSKVAQPIELLVEVNGEKYYTVKEFAKKVNHSEQSVRLLIKKGNRLRRLKCMKFLGKPLIPESELVEFPFTISGRTLGVYYYTREGQVAK